ncbi:MAG: hypothetical protein C4297_11105 [Gemmataceae bacterium]
MKAFDFLRNWWVRHACRKSLSAGDYDAAWHYARKLVGVPGSQAHNLLAALAQALANQAQKAWDAGDLAGAWSCLMRAEALQSPAVATAPMRERLEEAIVKQLGQLLSEGHLQKCLHVLGQLRQAGWASPSSDHYAEAARHLLVARDWLRSGQYRQARATLEQARALVPHLAALWEPQEQRLLQDCERLEALARDLTRAHEAGDWQRVVLISDELLLLAPEYEEARRARCLAWRANEPPTQVPASVAEPLASAPEPLSRRLVLWIDRVGAWLVCLSPKVSFGQATADASVDIPILADISRLHGYFLRDEEGYLIQAVRPVRVNHVETERSLLRHGDRITVGRNCQLVFQRPLPISTTALIQIQSGHRLPLSLDGILLLGESLILGPDQHHAHIAVAELPDRVILARARDGLALRCAGAFTVDGQRHTGQASLGAYASISIHGLQITLESVGPRLGPLYVGVGAT